MRQTIAQEIVASFLIDARQRQFEGVAHDFPETVEKDPLARAA